MKVSSNLTKSTINTNGLTALVMALNKPCECEQGITHLRLGAHLKRITTCARHPLPSPGYRWYKEIVREALAP